MRKTFRKPLKTRVREGRYRKTRFRRDYALFLAPIALAALLLAAVTQNAEVLAAAWRDPTSVLTQRSPGSRDAGALYHTKPERIVEHIRPTERILPVVRERFAPPAPPAEEIAFEEPMLMAFAPRLVGDLPPLAPAPPVLVVADLPTGPSAPVPEPQTWLMGILGLFAVGAAMRRRPWATPAATRPAPA